MPLVFLCGSMISEADADAMEVNVESSCQYLLHFVAMRQVTAQWQSDKMAPHIEVCMKQRSDFKFLHAEQ